MDVTLPAVLMGILTFIDLEKKEWVHFKKGSKKNYLNLLVYVNTILL